MVVRRFSVVVPKRGVPRLAQKKPATKKPAAYTKVAYVREKTAVGSCGVRKEQMKSKRSLAELLKASDDEIIEMLVADGMLPDWTGKQCLRCEKGQLSKLLQRPGRCGLKHRCNRKHCQMHMSPIHLHPWFMESNGTGAAPLQTQAAVLLLKLQNTSLPSTCQMLAVNHKLAEDMSTHLIYARQDYVKAHQPKIQLGRRRVISGT